MNELTMSLDVENTKSSNIFNIIWKGIVQKGIFWTIPFEIKVN